MAAFNSTQTLVAAGVAAFPARLQALPELEKISCSIKGESLVHPLELIGKHIRFAELVFSEIGLFEGSAFESSITCGNVLAVQIGSISQGMHTSLLIQGDEGFDPHYVDISKLTVLEVLQ